MVSNSNFKCVSVSAVLACLIWSGCAYPLGLSGTVKGEDGQPVAGVMVKVTSASAAALVTKVFTDAKGEYVVPDLGKNVGVNSIFFETFKLGYEQVQPQAKSLVAVSPKISKDVAQVDFVLKPTANIAAQVPASAWLASAPQSMEKQLTLIACTQCHQMPSERTKKLAEGLAGLDEAQREQVWRSMVASMRTAFVAVLTTDHAKVRTPEELAQIAVPEKSLFDKTDEDIAGRWLAKYMPTSFAQFNAADKTKFASTPLGVTKKTLIREFPYGDGAFTRETAVLNGEYWVVDYTHNRIGKIDLKTGAYTWHDVPSVGASKPHTIVPDGEGNLWMTLSGDGKDGGIAAVFNPKKNTWRIYNGFPKGMHGHDLSPAAGYRMGKSDMVWLTVITHNKIVGFNRTTGEVSPVYDLPAPEWGGAPFHISVYGGGMTSDQNYWFAQNNGVFGRFNVDTRKVDHVIDYGQGAGPHRMAIDRNDHIYLTLIGASQISVVDAKKLKEVKRIDMPDRASAPYAISWDERRNALWVATVNNDSLFKYDIKSGKFTEYPVGIKDLHMRMIAIDDKTGDLWIASSPLPNNEAEMRRVFLYHPGDV